LRGKGDGQGDRVVLHPEVTNGHSGVYQVGSLTASPPAAMDERDKKDVKDKTTESPDLARALL